MSTAPDTVAFLLCDIEGSTPLVHAAGADYATILNSVRRIIRGAVGERNGNVIDAHGDEMFVAFPSLDDAVDGRRRGPAEPDRGDLAGRSRRAGSGWESTSASRS